MEEVTESAEKGKKMNLFSNYFLLNLLLGAVEKEHHFKSLFLLLAEICVTEIQPCVFLILLLFFCLFRTKHLRDISTQKNNNNNKQNTE